MTVPNIFSGGGSLTSYDFTDIIAGTGIQTFYAGSIVSGTNLAYVIKDHPFYSQSITSKSGVGSTSLVKRFSRTFDLEFNTTRIVNGEVLVNIPMGMNMLTNVVGSSHTVSCEVWIYSADNNDNETFIVSGMTIPYSVSSTNVVSNDKAYSRMTCVPLSFNNVTFNSSKKLRMKIHVYAARGAAAEILAGIGHDPMSRDDLNEYLALVAGTDGCVIQNNTEGTDRFATDTTLSLQIPFKLEVDV
jgi:hypothetical protein